MDIGWPEILIIAVVILVLFGSKKLPDAARSLGKSLRIIKTEIGGLHEDESRPAAGSPPQITAAPQQPAGTTPADPTQPASTVGERPNSV